MTVAIREAEYKVNRGELLPYYGFDRELSYLVRTPRREYNGRTNSFQFLNGTTLAPAQPNKDEQWQWNRGEKLSQLRSSGYAVYVMGTEPAPNYEPLWAGQAGPTDLAGNDYGMDFGVVQRPQEPAVQPEPVGEPEPTVAERRAGRRSVEEGNEE